MWLEHFNLRGNILEWWDIWIDGFSMLILDKKLNLTKRKVKVWNKELFGDIFQQKIGIKYDLDVIQKSIQEVGDTIGMRHKENQSLVKYNDIITKEELF